MVTTPGLRPLRVTLPRWQRLCIFYYPDLHRKAKSLGGMNEGKNQMRNLAHRILISSWILAIIAMILPAYDGEFLTPGGDMLVIGIQFHLGPLIFALTAMAAGYVDAISILYVLMSIFPVLLFILTPLCLGERLSRHVWILMAAGITLITSGGIWCWYAMTFASGRDTLLFGAYVLPVPLLLSGTALCLIGISQPKMPTSRSAQ